MGRKRILAILLVVLFSACGFGGEQIPPAIVPLPLEQEPLIWWTAGPEPADFTTGMDHINDYLQSNMGLQLDMRMLPWRELQEKSMLIVNSGEYFDFMYIDSGNYNKYATLGAFQDITDMLRTSAVDLWSFIPERIWLGAKIDGRIYAVPTYKDTALAQYWVMDQDLADACGIDIREVNEWADLDAALMKIKAVKGEKFYPVLMTSNETFSGLFNGFDSLCSGLPIIGVRADDPERKVLCTLEDPMLLERLSLLRKWYLNGIINPDANTVQAFDGPRPFFSAVGWPGAEVIWQRNEGTRAYVSNLIYGPMLSSEAIQGSMNAIYSHSTRQQDSLAFLQRINLDPVLRDMFAYGVEGTHFEYVSDRVVQQLNNNWNVPIFSQATFFTMSTTTGWPENQWELVKAQNDRASNSVLLGFSMNISELSTEISACRAIWERYFVDLTTGASDPEQAIPQCIKELREAGMDIIISEAQKQITRLYS